MITEHKLPRAAVVIIAHNDEAHILRAIESVCHQTERNIEIICVDDGSTDGTYGIMCRCGEEDRRIRAITQPNSGALGARYAGLRQVTASCVLFLDSDDVFVPEAVDTACRAMDATGADVVEFGVRLMKAKDNPPTQDTWTFLSRYFSQEKPLPDTDHGPELARACFVQQAITWNIWNKLYRTETLLKAFQFYRGEWVCLEEDMLLTLMVLCVARHYERISEKLYVYTVGAGISTAAAKLTDTDAVKKAATEGLVLKLARDWLQKLGCTGEEAGLGALTEFVENGILQHIVNRVSAEKRGAYLKMLWQYSDEDDYFDLLARAISGQQGEIEQMGEQVARLAEENRRAGAAAEAQRQQTVLLEQENQRLRESFDTISNATLWKMTKPLRAVLDFVKGGGESNLRLFVRSLRVYGVRVTAEKTVRYLRRRAYDKKLAAQPEQRWEAVAPLQTMEELAQACNDRRYTVYAEEWLKRDARPGRSRVLLISHELDLTGAPIVLSYMAEWFAEKGVQPVVIARHDGPLGKVLGDKGIPVIVHEAVYQSDLVIRCARLFSLVVVNTIVGAPIIAQMGGTELPVLWWIHEARVSYHPGMLQRLPAQVGDNIRIYCVSHYAERILHEYRPLYSTRQLPYFIPDLADMRLGSACPVSLDGTKKVFVCVGTLDERKGQDILTDAIRRLTEEERRRSFFVFVGSKAHPHVARAVEEAVRDYPDSVLYIPQLAHEEVMALYQKADCLVCPSKDDPMPTTVTEAMSLSKLVICSENAGNAELLEKTGGAIIFRNNDPAELAECLARVIWDEEDADEIAARARQTYRDNFSKEVFGQRMERIYRSLTAKEPLPVEAAVSVIIPTFNGGNDLPGLLTLLADQVDVREMEIVVVDSGSTDNTRAIAADFGAKIIEISQAEFSHSFARNLGAEHASGEYLLFMTQDAKPGSLHWVRDMAQPLVRDDAVAVSCREEPRDDCDLLGRYSIWIHSKYMGILGRDRILSLPANESWDTMRKNAQLNDVACMIRRDVFRAFAYRGNYAEDLDLGLRLIKKGYRLALLGSAPVIHSHNRTAYYYLKRCLVDVTTLPRLLPGLPVERISADTAVNRILGMTAAVWRYVTALTEAQDVPTRRQAFFAWSARFFDGEAKRLRALDYGDLGLILAAKPPCCDRQFYDFVQDLYSHGERAFRVNTDWLDTRRNHVLAELENYLAYTDEPFTEETIGQIGELFVKQCGQAAGETLSAYLQSCGQDASFLRDWAEELQQGV